jgi:sulfur-oxidizing protein SoxA
MPPPHVAVLLRLVVAGTLAGAGLCSAARTAEIPLEDRRSGYDFMAPETKAMQDDRAANPGMLSVLEGERLWRARIGAAPSCADCHGEAAASMRGVAARHPAFDAKKGRAVDLEDRIDACHVENQSIENQNARRFRRESRELVSLTAYVAAQSRGMPISPPDDPRLAAVREQGREIFHLRQGQLNLSCSQCHDDNWGKRLAGAAIPQGHPTGYPVYRLEWQATGSLQRRLRNCLVGMRAEPFDDGGPEYVAPEYVALEAYLMWRARGMPIETPAVRP